VKAIPMRGGSFESPSLKARGCQFGSDGLGIERDQRSENSERREAPPVF